MTINLIMLTHNQLQITRHCISTLRLGDGVRLQIVDNGSQDGTREFLLDYQKKNESNVNVIFNEYNLGGCRGRNLGVANSEGDFLVFLDNDVSADGHDWAFQLCDHLTQSEYGAVGALLLFPDESNPVIQSAGGGVTRRGRFGLLRRGDPADGVGTGCRGVEARAWLPTAALACRRADFERVQGFDESLDPVSIGEDIDFCFRLKERGLLSVIAPSVRLFHYEGTTFNNSDFSQTKKEVFVRHSAMLRARWRRHFAEVPLATEDDVRYRLIEKHYTDPLRPRVFVRSGRDGSFADAKDGRPVSESSAADVLPWGDDR